MDSDIKIILQKQLEYYSGLIKEHEIAKKQHESTSIYHLSKNSKWQGGSYKMVKNSAEHSATNFKLTSKKLNPAAVINPNSRTVLYNNSNQFKSKYKLATNKVTRNINTPSNKIVFQEPVFNEEHAVQNRKPISSTEKISNEAFKMRSEISEKAVSNSVGLIKEIESLTKMLKKTSENKSKTVKNTSVKDSSVIKDRLSPIESSHKNLSGCEVFKKENIFSTMNQPKSLLKSNVCDIKSDIKSSVPFCKVLRSRSYVSEYKDKCVSKFCTRNVKMTKNPTVFNTSFESSEIEKNSRYEFQKNISIPNVQKLTCQDIRTVTNGTAFTSKPFSVKKIKCLATNKPVNLRSKVNKKYSCVAVKSQNDHKISSVPKLNCANNKYKTINVVPSVTSNKNLLLRNASHCRTSFKKSIGKVNTKFKLINKTDVSCANKIELNDSGCKENPLSSVKSDHLFKLLNDSTIDKLEQDLLALSTTLTATPTSIVNHNKKCVTSCDKMNTKRNFTKKTPLKKTKTKMSKYKVVNSFNSCGFPLKSRQNFIAYKSTRKINSKFNLVNMGRKSLYVTPIKQGKPILVKRLFKSKNAIVNKNVSPINHSAKMIKSKYFALNKKKSPCRKPYSYQNHTPFSSLKFKGSLSAKLYSKKNRYQKTSLLVNQLRTTRMFSHYGCHLNQKFNRHLSRRNMQSKKLRNGYVRAPVIFIRGLKYSLNSSGKTLRKLPAQGLTKIRHKRVINGKGYSRAFEKMKPVTPTSTNLASRVLYRSISRVLSATTKKGLAKVNTYCMFYNRFGRCNRGVKCTYIHDPSKIAVCTRFLRGTCKVDGCPFSHEITPGKMAICSFFLVGACDKNDCPYRHEKLSPNAKLCRAFVQGYCPNGKECKEAHILICPKYIQGNCEKGTFCAFPHPPQKVKKNVQKVADEKKPDDALLENVARYFQLSEENSLSCENKSNGKAKNVFVPPKQRKLEEQPSYIPLFDSFTLSNDKN